MYLTNDIAVTAAVEESTRNPTTAISAKSPDNIEAQPAATLSTYYIPLTPASTRRYLNATTSTFNAATVTVTTSVSEPKPATSADGQVTRLAALQETTHHMEEMAVGLQDIISGQINDSIANTSSNATHGGRISDLPATASATNASNPTPPLADMAVMDLPGGTIIFLNNTSPSYILVNHANASVIIWTSPANASDAASNSHIAKLVSKINAWLPYFEALGILTLTYKVGQFIYNRIQHRRRGQANAPQGAAGA
jgi:hypothetical protein